MVYVPRLFVFSANAEFASGGSHPGCSTCTNSQSLGSSSIFARQIEKLSACTILPERTEAHMQLLAPFECCNTSRVRDVRKLQTLVLPTLVMAAACVLDTTVHSAAEPMTRTAEFDAGFADSLASNMQRCSASSCRLRLRAGPEEFFLHYRRAFLFAGLILTGNLVVAAAAAC